MRIILLGPPGVGKCTQSKLISELYDIPHISTGDIFRMNIKNKTHLGMKVKEYIDEGRFVPYDLTIAIVNERINQDDCGKGFLLDDFRETCIRRVSWNHYYLLQANA